MTAPPPFPPAPFPWQQEESVGSTVTEWKGRWRRALLETSRLVCKYELTWHSLHFYTSEGSGRCHVVCQIVAACFGLAACLSIDVNVKRANLLASRYKDVNKSHITGLLWASFAATDVSQKLNILTKWCSRNDFRKTVNYFTLALRACSSAGILSPSVFELAALSTLVTSSSSSECCVAN